MSRRRNQRTVFLAVLAAASFAWMAIYQFDVPAEAIGHLQSLDIGNLQGGDGSVAQVVDAAGDGSEWCSLGARDS